MWRRREVELNEEQRAELGWMVKHDPKPYRRERAAAIMKVADRAQPVGQAPEPAHPTRPGTDLLPMG